MFFRPPARAFLCLATFAACLLLSLPPSEARSVGTAHYYQTLPDAKALAAFQKRREYPQAFLPAQLAFPTGTTEITVASPSPFNAVVVNWSFPADSEPNSSPPLEIQLTGEGIQTSWFPLAGALCSLEKPSPTYPDGTPNPFLDGTFGQLVMGDSNLYSLAVIRVRAANPLALARLSLLFIDSTTPDQEASLNQEPPASARSAPRDIYPKPPIVDRAAWGARAYVGTPDYCLQSTHLCLHHTAASSDYGATTLDACKARVRAHQNYHMDGNGWSDIGYNYLVCKHGDVFEGRQGGDYVRGAHDAYNCDSLGVAAMGYFHSPYNDQPTQALLDSTAELFAWMAGHVSSRINPYGTGMYRNYGASMRTIYGHRDVGSTSCPGDVLYAGYLGSNAGSGWLRDAVAELLTPIPTNTPTRTQTPLSTHTPTKTPTRTPTSTPSGTTVNLIVESYPGGQNYGWYSEVSTWADSTFSTCTASGCTAPYTRYTSASYAGRIADYKPQITEAGSYTVYAAWGDSGVDGANYKVIHAGGSTNNYLNQDDARKDTWVNIGTYTFTAGTSQGVELDRGTATAGNLRSAAVRFFKAGSVTATPTRSPTRTPTPLATNTPTRTPTSPPTATRTPTRTPTALPTWTPTRTPTRTPTGAPSYTPTRTPTTPPTFTPAPSGIPTWTPSRTPTGIPSWTPTRTPTGAPTSTATPTGAPTYTPTPQPPATPTFTPVLSTPTPSLTPTPSPTPTDSLAAKNPIAGYGTSILKAGRASILSIVVVAPGAAEVRAEFAPGGTGSYVTIPPAETGVFRLNMPGITPGIELQHTEHLLIIQGWNGWNRTQRWPYLNVNP